MKLLPLTECSDIVDKTASFVARNGEFCLKLFQIILCLWEPQNPPFI